MSEIVGQLSIAACGRCGCVATTGAVYDLADLSAADHALLAGPSSFNRDDPGECGCDCHFCFRWAWRLPMPTT